MIDAGGVGGGEPVASTGIAPVKIGNQLNSNPKPEHRL